MPLHRPLLRTALAVLVTALAGLALAGASASAHPADADLPSTIRIDDGHKPFLLAHAVGVQIYACSPTVDGPKWRLVAPDADLYADNGRLVATHFGGPTWQARDGSYVKAARVDGVIVDPTAIAWLKLKTTVTVAGPDGDRLEGTTFIQRIDTTGGVEPAAAECNAETVGAERRIPYTADYRFWKQGA